MDKDALLARSEKTQSGLPEDDVEIPGKGTVHVRGLSRGEVFAVQNATGVAYTERKILALGMLDPALSETEAGRWQENSKAAEIEPVVDKIRELSGLDAGAPKSGVPADGDAPGPGVRDVPGAEAGDDRGPDAG